MAKVPEVLLDWREHPARLTRIDSRYAVENFLRAKVRYLMEGPLQGRRSRRDHPRMPLVPSPQILSAPDPFEEKHFLDRLPGHALRQG